MKKPSAGHRRFALQDEIDPTRWLVTFNDLMTLLLTYFVMLLAMSNLDARRLRELQSNLFSASGIITSEGSQEKTIVEKVFKHGMQGQQLKMFTDLMRSLHIDKESKDKSDSSTIMPLSENVSRDFKVLQNEGAQKEIKTRAISQFRDIINDYAEMPGMAIIQNRRGIVLQLSDNILFETGEAMLKPKVYPVMDRLADIIKNTKFNVYIEGFTDNTPVHTERYTSNWELSISRAISIAEHLTTRCSVPPERIGVSGYADWRAAAPNDTEENKSKNRRVEIVLSEQ